MAVDLCSESSNLGMSPRISFSHDLRHADVVPVEQHNYRSDSSLLDFDFCLNESFQQESSSADELFCDGKILPTEIRKKIDPPRQTHKYKSPHHPPLPTTTPSPEPATSKTENSRKENLKEIIEESSEGDEKAPSVSKSFWRFKRSSSLNCGSGHKLSLICSLPLLSRSNSTGSSPVPKRPPFLKDNHKNPQKPPTITPIKFSASSSSSSVPSYLSSSQKRPLKKNYGSYSNGDKNKKK
uniref:Uncharacterized protein n=1 Tax=Nelumbo nucifera TaxID=4432 RepID=A0A822YS81_NELNU|nr:TPA_asm: hypothetical protein HUJ06_006027 [Nelumbo nucifera]